MHFLSTTLALTGFITTTVCDINFKIAHSECSWFTYYPGGGNIDIENYWSFPSGSGSVGCSAFNNLPQYGGSIDDPIDFFNANICGMSVNFYNNDGTYNFYKDGGDGTLLGTCYKTWNPGYTSCFEGFSNCVVNEDYNCQESYLGTPPC